jgi:hypothetical protein
LIYALKNFIQFEFFLNYCILNTDHFLIIILN